MGPNKTVSIEQGHLMTPTSFMTYSMVIDPKKSVVVTWTPHTTVFYATGLPALISTGITFIYFSLKLGRYLLHAISHQTEGRVATATPGCGEQKHSPITGTEGHSEVCDKIPGHFEEQYGRGT